MCAVICRLYTVLRDDRCTNDVQPKRGGRYKVDLARMIYEAYNTKESIISTIVGNQLITVDIASFRVEMKPPITWT